MNIGAGRVVLQDDVRLDLALKDGSFYRNEVFLETMSKIRQRKSALHLLALLSKKVLMVRSNIRWHCCLWPRSRD